MIALASRSTPILDSKPIVAISDDDRKDVERIKISSRRLCVVFVRNPSIEELAARAGFNLVQTQQLIELANEWDLGHIDVSGGAQQPETAASATSPPERGQNCRTSRLKVFVESVTRLGVICSSAADRTNGSPAFAVSTFAP